MTSAYHAQTLEPTALTVNQRPFHARVILNAASTNRMLRKTIYTAYLALQGWQELDGYLWLLAPASRYFYYIIIKTITAIQK